MSHNNKSLKNRLAAIESKVDKLLEKIDSLELTLMVASSTIQRIDFDLPNDPEYKEATLKCLETEAALLEHMLHQRQQTGEV